MKDYSRGATSGMRARACDLKPGKSMLRPWDSGSASPESDQQFADPLSQLIKPEAVEGAGAT